MAAIESLSPYELPPNAIRWTREMCMRLPEIGIEIAKLELVEGALLKSVGNMPHSIMIQRLLQWFFDTFGARHVFTRASIDVCPEDIPTNEPMPE